ncbi:hypothetical protein U9M48_004901 [Paspalum notatum var. saurae]|uniref:Uncharacterized protein n=1 Tax=Paspalum notatum var. saurae TaxID=547442 RepID=A0AAQ3SLK8_PASNO
MSARELDEEEGDAHGGVWAPWSLGAGEEGDVRRAIQISNASGSHRNLILTSLILHHTSIQRLLLLLCCSGARRPTPRSRSAPPAPLRHPVAARRLSLLPLRATLHRPAFPWALLHCRGQRLPLCSTPPAPLRHPVAARRPSLLPLRATLRRPALLCVLLRLRGHPPSTALARKDPNLKLSRRVR